jgi:large subunit ribosomal protein L10
MNRVRKEAVVAEFKDMFERSPATFIVQYGGLNVGSMQSLRKNLREHGGVVRVAKARLMKIAASQAERADEFKGNLKSQVALVFATQEVPAVAKVLVEFAKDQSSLAVVSGYFENKPIGSSLIQVLAILPPREVMLAQLAAVIQAPIISLARALNEINAKLARAVQQVAEKAQES